jgi:hypothetical protein
MGHRWHGLGERRLAKVVTDIVKGRKNSFGIKQSCCHVICTTQVDRRGMSFGMDCYNDGSIFIYTTPGFGFEVDFLYYLSLLVMFEMIW